jgi:hypothetical protein
MRRTKQCSSSARKQRILSGLLYAKYRQLLEAKCFRAGVELILVDPAYTSIIAAVKYAARRSFSVHAAAAAVIARRAPKLTSKCLSRPDAVVRVLVKGDYHALELRARKSRDSRATAWRDVHAAYRGMVREQWLATRCGKPRRSARGTNSRDDNSTSPQQGPPLPLRQQSTCAGLSTIKLAVVRRSRRVPTRIIGTIRFAHDEMNDVLPLMPIGLTVREALTHFRHPPTHKIPTVIVETPKHLGYICSLISCPIRRTPQQCLQREVKYIRQLNQTLERRQRKAALEARDGLLLNAELLSKLLLRQLPRYALPRNGSSNLGCNPRCCRRCRHIEPTHVLWLNDMQCGTSAR